MNEKFFTPAMFSTAFFVAFSLFSAAPALCNGGYGGPTSVIGGRWTGHQGYYGPERPFERGANVVLLDCAGNVRKNFGFFSDLEWEELKREYYIKAQRTPTEGYISVGEGKWEETFYVYLGYVPYRNARCEREDLSRIKLRANGS